MGAEGESWTDTKEHSLQPLKRKHASPRSAYTMRCLNDHEEYPGHWRPPGHGVNTMRSGRHLGVTGTPFRKTNRKSKEKTSTEENNATTAHSNWNQASQGKGERKRGCNAKSTYGTDVSRKIHITPEIDENIVLITKWINICRSASIQNV